MSILFKGVEMPKGCWDCPFQTNPICATNDILNFTTRIARPDNCPLIGIPHHGRLIDADALMLVIQEYIDEYGWDVDEHGFHSEKWCAMKETEMAINDAPTVITDDKDGET